MLGLALGDAELFAAEDDEGEHEKVVRITELEFESVGIVEGATATVELDAIA